MHDRDRARIHTHLLLRLAQGRSHGVLIAIVHPATGKGDLPGVGSQRVGALGEHHLLPARRVRAEKHEHGGPPVGAGGRRKVGEPLVAILLDSMDGRRAPGWHPRQRVSAHDSGPGGGVGAAAPGASS